MEEDWDNENSYSGGASMMNNTSSGHVLGVGRGKSFGQDGFGAKDQGRPGWGGYDGRSGFQAENGSGGRFGGGRDGGRPNGRSSACFKCGEEGHMSRDCPNPSSQGGRGGRGGGGGGGRGCYKCNQEGHMARDCPNADGDRRSKDCFGTSSFGGSAMQNEDEDWGGGSSIQGGSGFETHNSFGTKQSFGGSGFGGGSFGNTESDGHYNSTERSDSPKFGGFGSRRNGNDSDRTGGDRKGCFKCGEEGHMSRDCPNAGGSGGRSGGRGCYKCGEEGHMSRDCPNADAGGSGGRSGGRACYKCGEEGHMSRDCPKADAGGSGGRSGGKGCFKCGEEGHMSRDCPNADAGGGSGGRGGGKGCFKCGETDHISRDCPKAAASGEPGKKVVPMYIPPPPPEGEEAIFETIAKGINFSRYDEISVECTGSNAPARGITSFDEADIDDIFKQNVKKSRYERPTPIQKWAIPVILSGRDLMGCAQTGSGKTAAFLLPVLSGMRRNGIEGSAFSEVQEPQALVVGPTRELVVQIYNEARKFAYGTMIRPVVLYGGVSVNYQLGQVDEGAHIVVGTPGRLLDVIKRKRISLAKVKYFILDEADRMLDLGFKSEMLELARSFGMPQDRQTLMFSATFPEEIQQLARSLLNDYIFITVGRVGGANWDIKQDIYVVGQNEKRDKLVSILNETGNERTLIFVEQKRQADFLASFLSQSSFPTTSIHGDREQREREEALRDFKTARAPILVATSVAARGLDIANVMHVVNYDMPSTIEEYVHRIGRTGRCGNIGKATSFFNPDTDRELARALVRVLSDAQQPVPAWLEEMSEASLGAGGFMGVGGGFGSRDTRKGKFGGDGEAFNEAPGAGRVFGGMASAGAGGGEEEEWS